MPSFWIMQPTRVAAKDLLGDFSRSDACSIRSRRSSSHTQATSLSMSFGLPPSRANLRANRQNPLATICEPILDRLALPAPSETTAIRVGPFRVLISTQAAASSQPVPLATCEVPIEQAPIQLHRSSFTPRSPSHLGQSGSLVQRPALVASVTRKKETQITTGKGRETEDLVT
jgi:hypothetical protein